jgi:radical SAM protein with 4Fe4S-binding SPASM domain
LKCSHCGSRAGTRRKGELSTEECLELVDRFAELGVREITIIGGEAFLRRDWLEIVQSINGRKMLCTLQTGGFGVTEVLLQRAFDAGLGGIGVSIDGLEELHDRLRGVKGSYGAAIATLGAATKVGLVASVNTQIGEAVLPELQHLMAVIAEAGAKFWQVQLTVAMGNAVDNPDQLLQPHRLLTLMPLLAALYESEIGKRLPIIAGNNIGYFGPFEVLWRGPERGGHYAGCPAGQNVIGVEADGTIKGCPSLATARYAAGNIRDARIEDIWNNSGAMQFNRQRSLEQLWGYCAECYYREACRGGCTWTADSLLGKPGNNPYCHHRALQLAARGLQERIEKLADAGPESFATGLFSVVQEPLAENYKEAVWAAGQRR